MKLLVEMFAQKVCPLWVFPDVGARLLRNRTYEAHELEALCMLYREVRTGERLCMIMIPLAKSSYASQWS
jgi:hypothetical protein